MDNYNEPNAVPGTTKQFDATIGKDIQDFNDAGAPVKPQKTVQVATISDMFALKPLNQITEKVEFYARGLKWEWTIRKANAEEVERYRKEATEMVPAPENSQRGPRNRRERRQGPSVEMQMVQAVNAPKHFAILIARHLIEPKIDLHELSMATGGLCITVEEWLIEMFPLETLAEIVEVIMDDEITDEEIKN